jgi:hypothetical protein
MRPSVLPSSQEESQLLSTPDESCSSTQTCKDVYPGHFAK